MIYETMDTDLAGTLVLAGDEKGLRHLNFMAGRHPLAIGKTWRRDPAYFSALKDQLSAYFAGEIQSFDAALFPEGTPFQMQVWAALKEIPYGSVVSYRWIADRIGKPKAMRAVGAANGRNPISIIIPCHRVIGSDGSLTGYGGGMDVKRRLLRLENPKLLTPTQTSLPLHDDILKERGSICIGAPP
ncbi:methylated-DNA--protein-cysteine methyltransferase [Desulfosarcina widdelii]|uniref:Methylated-DNA--protein-cysteine methyltransferase n=1 Tax=Desulfosarcina widdelii TaxID=947919 RepID=A0A5K7Z4K3_9BACT|nr:methylated-DNA--[protein]-cysteine S-methyltransferase [Desulfosarcina widdelii]BBO76932.1 methylated-DNA--protein-cysteine methyltransferase [Desulfosarcina widdelii]